MSEHEPLSPWEQKLENNVEMSTLCAFYGGLLTPKQRQALTLHCDEDLSLGEIAQQLGVSRQNVHDLIARSAEKLRAYEAALGAARRMEAMRSGLTRARELLEAAAAQPVPPQAREAILQARELIHQTIEQQEEDAHGV